MPKKKDKVYAQVIKENMRVNLIGGQDEGLYPFDLRLAFTVDITDRPGVKIGMIYNPSLDEFEDDGKWFSLPEPEPEPTIDDVFELLLDLQCESARKIGGGSPWARMLKRLIDIGRSDGIADKIAALVDTGKITKADAAELSEKLGGGDKK